MAFMRAFIVGAVVAGCLAGPARAQKQDNPRAIEAAEKKKAAEKIDQQYKAALERERKEAAGPQDPWANMRGPETPKAKR